MPPLGPSVVVQPLIVAMSRPAGSTARSVTVSVQPNLVESNLTAVAEAQIRLTIGPESDQSCRLGLVVGVGSAADEQRAVCAGADRGALWADGKFSLDSVLIEAWIELTVRQ